MVIEIPLTKGYVAIVDDEDKDLASYRWFAIVDKSGGVYAARKLSGKPRRQEWLHKVVLSRVIKRTPEKGELGDHIDGNTLNSIRSNIRIATVAQNVKNRRRAKNNTSGYKGVSYVKRNGRWKATIHANGKSNYLGMFDTAEEAHAAYCEAAIKYYGEFANFG